MALQSRLFTLGVAVASLFIASAKADVILSVESVSAGVGSTNDTFDVTLLNTGAPIDVGGFFFELQSSSANVTFDQVLTSTTTATYIFDGSSLFGPKIDSQDSPTLVASDLSTGSTTVGTGDTFGLGQVFFNVSPSAIAGPVTISFVAGGTSLANVAGADIPITTLDTGTITITSTTPEPSSIALMLAGGVALLLSLRIRASRAALRVTQL